MGVQTQINRIQNEVDDQTNLISHIQTALADKTSLGKHASTHATDGSDPITPASIGAKAADESDIFIATYGTTTSAEIEAAYQAVKTVVCVYKDSVYYLSSRMSEKRHIFSTIFSMDISASMSSYLRKISCISDVWESSKNLGFKPEAHASNHATGGSDPITPASIGAKAADESDIFIAKYGTTTNAEIEAAYQAGKVVFLHSNGQLPIVPLTRRAGEHTHIFTIATGNVKEIQYKCYNNNWSSTPLNTHASTHATGGSDPITPASIGAAAQSTTTEATLSAASWSGDSAPYTYTLTVNGVTDTSTQEIVFATSINLEQLTAGQNANIQDGGQSANTIVLKAWGEKPTVDLPIRVIMRG